MLRVITANLNGIRSAASKGFFSWLEQQNADIVCLQETKAQISQLEDPVFHPPGYYICYNDAEKKGYSGTAIYSRHKPQAWVTRLGWPSADSEGRFVQADFEKLSVISLYMPSGSSSEAAQAKKFDFLDRFMVHLKALREHDRQFIICADWNICHKPIDLKNWKGNLKNSGFLPEERAWLDHLYDEVGYIDAFRIVNQEADQYTWWSNRGQARANNVGWRLDYAIITPGLKDHVSAVKIYREERFSDHAPVITDFEIDI
jgi:exodeoxyribonuclease-3